MTPKTPAAENTGPLTPAMFHVLLALAGDSLHGYAILKEVEMRTDGEVKLSTGTLYGIIKRLLNDGLIIERRERPAAHDEPVADAFLQGDQRLRVAIVHGDRRADGGEDVDVVQEKLPSISV